MFAVNCDVSGYITYYIICYTLYIICCHSHCCHETVVLVTVVLRWKENTEVCFLLTVFDLVVLASTVLYTWLCLLRLCCTLGCACFDCVVHLVVLASTVLCLDILYNTVEANTTKSKTFNKKHTSVSSFFFGCITVVLPAGLSKVCTYASCDWLSSSRIWTCPDILYNTVEANTTKSKTVNKKHTSIFSFCLSTTDTSTTVSWEQWLWQQGRSRPRVVGC